jgi:hypothetical protein
MGGLLARPVEEKTVQPSSSEAIVELVFSTLFSLNLSAIQTVAKLLLESPSE